MIDEWISLRWEKETHYYEVHLHPDLWGEWVLTQVWGRRGMALGWVVYTSCLSYHNTQDQLAGVQARRKR